MTYTEKHSDCVAAGRMWRRKTFLSFSDEPLLSDGIIYAAVLPHIL